MLIVDSLLVALPLIALGAFLGALVTRAVMPSPTPGVVNLDAIVPAIRRPRRSARVRVGGVK
jgi:hypothetical protein